MRLSKFASLLLAFLVFAGLLLPQATAQIDDSTLQTNLEIYNRLLPEDRADFLHNLLPPEESAELQAFLQQNGKIDEQDLPKPLTVKDYYFTTYPRGVRVLFQNGENLFNMANRPNQEPYDRSLVTIEPEIPFEIYLCYQNACAITGPFEPRSFYQITLKAGFPHEDAPNRLLADYTISGIVPDLPSQAGLASEGVFFPLHAPVWELPIRSVNYTDKLPVKVYQPYLETLPQYLSQGLDWRESPDRWARQISKTEIQLDDRPNQDVFTALNLADLGLPKGRPGIYNLEIEYDLNYSYSTTQRIVITDLALFATAANGEYLCQVRSLSHPETPVAGVKITLFSRKLQTLATSTTDTHGVARFRILPLQDKTDQPALLLAQNPDNNDVSYLSLTSYYYNHEGKFTTIQDPNAPQGFLTADRGIALPGEEVSFVALLRDAQTNRPIPNLPLEFRVTDPNGTFVSAQNVTTDAFGLFTCPVKFAPEALLGPYKAIIALPGSNGYPAIATTTLLLANFVPDQITARLDMPRTFGPEASQAKIDLQADYYFGEPAANTEVEARLSCQYLQPIIPLEARDFTFGLEEAVHSSSSNLTSHPLLKGRTDKQGHWNFAFDLPDVLRKTQYPALPIGLTVQATVKPDATRAITISSEARYDTFNQYLGSRVSQEEESRVQIHLLAVSPEGKRTELPRDLYVQVTRLTWQYLLKEQGDNTYRRQWQRVSQKIREESIQPDQDGKVWLTLPADGNYVCLFTDIQGREYNALSFWHYAGASEEHSPNPNRLTFQYDANQYLPGQTAKITFDSNFDGTCLIVSGSHFSSLQTQTQPLHAGENTIEIQIPETLFQTSWFVGVTAVGTIREEADGTLHDAPCLTGIARLAVDQKSRQLAVTLTAPAEARPAQTIDVSLSLADDQGTPVAGEIALWGVDEGILTLTDYQTPDVYKAFFANAECPFEMASLYPELYPMLRVVNGKIGGGFGAYSKMTADFQGRMADLDEPPHIVPITLLKTDASGQVDATIKLPDFPGSLRLMALATDDTTRLGNAQAQVVMHNPVTLTLLAPRVLAPGDVVELRAGVFNQEIPDATFAWSLGRDQEGFVPSTGNITLPKGENTTLKAHLQIPADTAEGPLPILLTLQAPDGSRYEKRTVITIRSHLPLRPVAEIKLLQPGQEYIVELTGKATDRLSVGSPVARLLRHWNWLNEYPYGCLEQITAAAFPQLAVADLVAAGRLPALMAAGARQRIQDTLGKYYAYRSYGGFYTMWPDSRNATAWNSGSLFAFLFQVEASRAGFPLSIGERQALLTNLRTFLNDRTNLLEERAQALYILALLSPTLAEPYAKMLQADAREEHPYAQFLAAMALLRAGYAAEGAELWNSLRDTEFTRLHIESVTLATPLRRTGLALWLLADLLPEDPALPRLATTLDALARDDQYFTTQDHAWYALGLAKYLLTLPKPAAEATFSATLAPVDSSAGAPTPLDLSGEKALEISGKDGFFELTNTGSEPLTVVHSYRTRNASTEGEDAGLRLRREYLDKDGKPATSCRVGDLLTVRLSLSGADAENLVLSDLLPAGFEIEDSQLRTRFNHPTRKIGAPTTDLTANIVEKRFDRLLWFGDFAESPAPKTFTYQIRAVTPGTFQIPPAQIEAMYQPQIHSISFPETKAFTITE